MVEMICQRGRAAVVFGVCLLLSCQQPPRCPGKLPVLGEREMRGKDTLYHTVPDFEFINQDSMPVNAATFSGKAYVVDFFFISCPTICPKVMQQMLRVYKHFQEEPGIMFLSHTIDVRHDTIPRLKAYCEGLGVSSSKWHFVTGEESEIYGIADDYFSVAVKDNSAPGGFDHSGRLILVDSQRRIRSFCDGTDSESVNQFIRDIECLLHEDH